MCLFKCVAAFVITEHCSFGVAPQNITKKEWYRI